MKSVLMSLVLVAAFQTRAASTDAPVTPPTVHVELGKYQAVDAETKSIVADFELLADGKVNFTVTSPDFTMPAPGCVGTYKVEGVIFSADVKCPTPLLPQAVVKIDVSAVTAEGLHGAEGVLVNVIIDAFGDEATPFLLKKNDPLPL